MEESSWVWVVDDEIVMSFVAWRFDLKDASFRISLRTLPFRDNRFELAEDSPSCL